LEPRKATDIILQLEAKIDTLLGMLQAQALDLRVLSNKLNILLESQRQQLQKVATPSIEAVNSKSSSVDLERQIAISAEATLPIEQNPQGFRRTSRPETYAGDNAYLNRNEVSTKFPVQIPQKQAVADITVPSEATQDTTQFIEHEPAIPSQQNSIPVVQRIVDANGKSVFLADVEVTNRDDGKLVHKARTNGTGKWMASLLPGNYRVVLRKRDPVTKARVEAAQDIIIDGKTSPINLQMLIFK